MANENIVYSPPPTIKAFIRDYIPGELFYDWIIGPFGSGKTTALFFKLVHMAQLQEKSSDGIRHTRAVIVRNTAPQLRDTTLTSWNYWFKDGIAGEWRATDRIFVLRFGDVECEVLFRALDTADDVARVLSLEVTFAILDEFVQIPRAIIEALAGRLGRWRAYGEPTNFGMWGSSNPDTEDNWWHDYLHDSAVVEKFENVRDLVLARLLQGESRAGRNVRYFHQPSGFSPDAENVEHLPKEYYKNLALGKSMGWIKQFIESQWGFSASGKPVVPTFRPDIHVVHTGLKFQLAYPLIGGLDPGIEGTAMIFGQEDLYGRLLVLGELFSSGVGSERFIKEKLRPYLKNHFPDADFVIAPDPAAASRAQSDEKTVVQVFQNFFGRDKVRPETNNRLPLRLNAIEEYTGRNTEMGPALMIDAKKCPMLLRALGGGWRFDKMNSKATESGAIKPVPEKNQYSHIGDAFGYLCRYFARQYERGGTRGCTVAERRDKRPIGNSPARYHFV